MFGYCAMTYVSVNGTELDRMNESKRVLKDCIENKTSFDGDMYDLNVGNLSAKRDRSHTKDMVHGMYLMLQQSTAKDLCEYCDKCD